MNEINIFWFDYKQLYYYYYYSFLFLYTVLVLAHENSYLYISMVICLFSTLTTL